MGGQQLPTIRMPASHAGGIKTDARKRRMPENSRCRKTGKKRLGVASAEHRTLARSADRRYCCRLAAWGALSPPLSPTATCGYVGDPKGGGIPPRAERLHNYPALKAPDTGHYIYYPCGNFSMVGSSLPAAPPVRSAKTRHFSIAEREKEKGI